MQVVRPIAQTPPTGISPLDRRTWRRAFTIMELMVSIAILVIIILAVGVTFSGASNAVGSSQAVMEEMSAVRAVQGQLEQDFKGLDRNGFLVIRSRVNTTSTEQFDQVSFISLGQFANRTGANTNSPFSDGGVLANAAHVWWGQGIVEKDSSQNPDPSYLLPNQGATTPQAMLPTGAYDIGGQRVIKGNEFVLMTHKTLLMGDHLGAGNTISPAGVPLMAYPSIVLDTPTITGNEGVPAQISSSRYAVAAQTPAQVMQALASFHNAGETMPEYWRCTYRFRALASVYDTELGSFVNGYFRTTPIVMPAVSSFKVEWTDGTSFPSGDPRGRGGLLKWYGPGLLSNDTSVEQFNRNGVANGDQYVAIFSYFNKAKWPKALRISMHVVNDRIGGRDFVQVINLP